MIKINVQTTSKGGAIIPAGSVLNIKVNIVTRKELVDDVVVTKYDVGFDSDVYGSYERWRSEVNSEVISRGEMIEYPVSHYAIDVPLKDLSASSLQELYKGIIENGTGNYPGVGVGNAEIKNA